MTRRSLARRQARARFTVRGSALLVGGLTLIVLAFALGQPALLSAGLLPLLLVLGALGLTTDRSTSTFTHRVLSAPLTPAGSTVHIRAEVGSSSPARLRWRETLPAGFGPPPTLLTAGREHHHLDYELTPDRRGRFPIGPMEVSRSDPFDLLTRRWSTSQTTILTVTPATVALPAIDLTGPRGAHGPHHAWSYATGTPEDAVVREYRRGDDLRRVHWPTSARVGELMVRNEEEPRQARASVLIDHRRSAHHGHGAMSSLEAAISVAASLCTHFVAAGYAVRLVGVEGTLVPHSTSVAPLLESLTDLTTSTATGLVLGAMDGAEPDGVVVAVLADGEGLEVRPARGAGLALVLDAGRWGQAEPISGPASAPTSGPPGATASMLSAGGWRSTMLTPSSDLAASWTSLGARHGAR